MAERQGDGRFRCRGVLCVLPLPDGLCGQQRLIVQRHAGAAVLRNKLLEIYLFVTEDWRPHEYSRCRIHEALAADRDLKNVVAVDAGTVCKSRKARQYPTSERAFFSRDPLLGKAVHQLAGIIDERILHAVGGDDDDRNVAEVAAWREEDTRPPASGSGKLFFPEDEPRTFEFHGDGGNGCGGKPGESRHVGMGKTAVQTQCRHHRQAVFLAHQFRACNGGHGLGHAP
ncbi:hypothetical protein D3C78_1333220 [compost metagenome]